MSIILLIAALNLALWLYLLLMHGGFWRTVFLGVLDAPLPTTWPDVCVVIPARNEASMLNATLPTLFAHDYPALRLILVDDRSEDGTAAAATRIAKECDAPDRLDIVTGRKLPGFKGKVAAMQCGLQQVTAMNHPPRYVLFTDADIAYDKGALRRLVAHAEAGDYVLASHMVRLRCKSPAERWLIPAFVYFFEMLYPFHRVNDPARKIAAAAGGCMLVRYDALVKAGGLEPIRAALIDDCAMGRMMKRQGRIWLGLTQDVHSLRAYPHVSDIRAMVARTAYDQLGYSPLNLTATLMGLIFTFIAPVLLALMGNTPERLMGLASWACMSITFIPLLRFYGRSPLMGATLPAIASAYMGFTLDSALQHRRGRGGFWKGRAQAAGMTGE